MRTLVYFPEEALTHSDSLRRELLATNSLESLRYEERWNPLRRFHSSLPVRALVYFAGGLVDVGNVSVVCIVDVLSGTLSGVRTR